MSSQTNEFYEFADLRLDLSEKVLLRGGKPIPLTPKIFDTLKVLVKNAGRLLEKDELMREVWPDRFVEEGNLAFNIKVIRKALGGDASNPKFIETIPRRGYRFIAKVTHVSEDPISSKQTAGVNDGPHADLSGRPQRNGSFLPVLFVSVILLAAVVVAGLWYSRAKTAAPVLSAPFSSERLSNDGKVPEAAISPDGKEVVYISGTGVDKESLWLRQVESGSSTEIIAPSDDIYGGLAVSPDENYLYFDRRPRNSEGQMDIYRISVLGGIPSKIIAETQGWIGISPDGKKISFVRCYYREDENCSLWLADATDGSNQQKLAARPRPFRIGDNKFSPDGKSVAFAVGQSANQSNEFGVAAVDLTTGQERKISEEKFFNIKSLAWLPDESGLLVTASRMPNKNYRVWEVDLSMNRAFPLTSSSETYASLSLDKNADRLAAIKVNEDFNLLEYRTEKPSASTFLGSAETISFTPDDRILFSSLMSGNEEIWSMNAVGSDKKQLTNDLSDKSSPFAAPDNSAIYFASNQSGVVQVWQMNPDGSDMKQLTHVNGGFPLFVSPEGQWVYYHHGTDRTLWRVSTRSTEEQQVLDKPSDYFTVSPTGSQVAYLDKQGDQWTLTVAALNDGRTLKTFPLADRMSQLCNIVWMPGGKVLEYISTNPALAKNFLWKQRLDESAPHKIAAMGDGLIISQLSLAVSPDSKVLAVVQGKWRYDAVLIRGLHLQ